jgi:cell division septum initiation protein DivIVA
MDPSDSGLSATEFARVRRGYDPDEVDAFRQQAVEHAQKLESTIAELKRSSESYQGEIEKLNQRLENTNPGEQSLDRILADARQTREQMLSEAQTAADRIRAQAAADAQAQIAEARATRAATTGEADGLLSAATTEIEALRSEAEAKARAILQRDPGEGPKRCRGDERRGRAEPR